MRLDLGAVAKGWILDRALASLLDGGAQGALAEAGGDLVVRGAPPGARAWRIGVPRAHGDTVLLLRAGAVSSSGPEMQRLGASDGGESHVLDARTGRGLAGDETVTVVGANGAIVDALSTALSLTVAAKRRALADRFGVSVIPR
jgi:thiamine biosynthesis lipoprotein